MTDRANSADVIHSSLAYIPALRKYFQRRVAQADAEDLTQEVFRRMLERPGPSEILNLSGYLFQVAANVLAEKHRRDHVRRSSLHVEFTEAHHDQDGNTPEHNLIGMDQIHVLMDMIQDLPPRTRAAFVLHRFEDMNYQAIAKEMGISVSAVEKHIMRAIGRLTTCMRASEG